MKIPFFLINYPRNASAVWGFLNYNGAMGCGGVLVAQVDIEATFLLAACLFRCFCVSFKNNNEISSKLGPGLGLADLMCPREIRRSFVQCLEKVLSEFLHFIKWHRSRAEEQFPYFLFI